VAEHGHSHGHSHSGGHPHHDLGTKAVLIHVMGDAFNNLGVIVAAVVLWKAKSDKRYYADPAVSMVIGLVLIMTALKLG
jgi:zinc transporter 1